jgi:hypothetical protein
MATGKISEEAINAAAEAAEFVAEESTQVAEATRALSSREVSLVFGGISFGVGVGAVAGYLYAKKRLTTKYDKIAEEEIDGMRKHYQSKLRALEASEEKKSLTDAVSDLKYAEKEKGPSGIVSYDKVERNQTLEVVPEPEVQNVFEKPQPEVVTPEWDYAVEIKSRTHEDPYIIHRDEYVEGEKNYDQRTYTYFEGDDVLCDESENIVEDQHETIGMHNMLKWGHGSNDPNVIYVRNEVLELDIEVTHSDGRFATEVHGFNEDELQHSSMRRRPPRRFDDGSSG